MIEKEMMRLPTGQEKEMIGKIKDSVVNSELTYLICAFFGLIGSALITVAMIQKEWFELSPIFITICIPLILFFCGLCVMCAGNYKAAVKEREKDDDEWFVIDGIAEDVKIDDDNCVVIGIIGKEKKCQMEFEVESEVDEKLINNKAFALFFNNDDLYTAVGISGEIVIANNIVIGEELEDYEND